MSYRGNDGPKFQTFNKNDIQRDIDASKAAGDPTPGAIKHGAMLLAELNGDGCGMGTCKCSPDFFISVSDSTGYGISVRLTRAEARKLLTTGTLDIRGK